MGVAECVPSHARHLEHHLIGIGYENLPGKLFEKDLVLLPCTRNSARPGRLNTFAVVACR
jgi:hypothetical protein